MMAGRVGTKPRRVPAQSEGDWRLVKQTQGGGGSRTCLSLTLQVPALIHVTPRASFLRGMKTRRQVHNEDLFPGRPSLGRGHRSSLEPLSQATLVAEHRYWLNVSDHSS